jgi:predicted nucleotidyltransferase
MPSKIPQLGRPSLGLAKRVRLSMTFKPSLVAQIAAQAAQEGLSASRLAEQLLEDGLRAKTREASVWEARLGVEAEQVSALCQGLGLKRLALFGSALTGRFKAGSDVDLLVEFKPGVVKTLLDRGRIQMEFEKLFKRKVDLAELRLIDNPIRRQAIVAEQEEIYAAGEA